MNLPSDGIRPTPVVGCLEASDVRNPDIPFHCAEYCSCDGCMRSTWDGWAVTLKFSLCSAGIFCGFSWVATFCYLVEEGSEGTTPWLCSWCLSTGYTLACLALVRLLGEFLLRHKLILWNETISRVRGESAQFGENMLPSSGSCSVLKLNGHRHWGRFIGVEILGLTLRLQRWTLAVHSTDTIHSYSRGDLFHPKISQKNKATKRNALRETLGNRR